MTPERRYTGGRLFLSFDALRGMRPRQIAWRTRRLIPPAWLAIGTRARNQPQPQLVAEGLGCSPAPQSGPTKPPHETEEFAAYGTSRRFGDPAFWTDPRDGLLFLFHLHGFAPLAEYTRGMRTPEGDGFWARVVESWLEEHDRPRHPAWHPYPTSVRLISWSAALSALDDWPSELRGRIAAAVLRQGLYVQRAVEHDIGGNHVIKNATGLAFAGTLFPSSRLLDSALRLLRTETARQVLPDGGHEERSTSYHREVAADLADVCALLERTGRPQPQWLTGALARMESWLAALVGPDGRVPMLNDAWEGPAIVAERSGPVRVLRESGYVILRHSDDQLVFDSGALCPPHLPPHAHADALSFVLWAGGRPVIADPGTFAYTGPERDRFRATAAHSTVEIEGRNQCCFWGDFRAAWLPRVGSPRVSHEGGVVVLVSHHDGYRRLSDPVVHERMIVWWPVHGVVVLDRLRCRQDHKVSSRLHLAPSISYRDGKVGPYEVQVLGRPVPIEEEPTQFSPFLGSMRPNTSLTVKPTLSPGELTGWALLRPGADVISLGPEALVLSSDTGMVHVPIFPE